MWRQYNGETLEQLKQAGYYRVSNNHRIIARIDIPKEELVKFLTQHSEGWKRILRRNNYKPLWWILDSYRRVHSKDNIINVPESIYYSLLNSSDPRAS